MRLESTPRPYGEVPTGFLLAAALFFLPLGAWLVETQTIELSQCGLKSAFGIPCFSCGSTRATMLLLGGDVLGAIAMQPLTMLIFALILAWGVISGAAFLRGRSVRLKLGRREGLFAKLAIVALPLVNWVYLYANGI